MVRRYPVMRSAGVLTSVSPWPWLYRVVVSASVAMAVSVWSYGAHSLDRMMFDRAQRLACEQKTDSAVNELRGLLGDYPHHYLGWLALARLYDRAGQSEAALCACRKASATNPGWVEPALLSAGILERQGRFEDAARELEACLPTADSHVRENLRKRTAALHRRAAGNGQSGIVSRAIPGIDSIVPAPSRTPEIETLFRKAVEQYENRNYEGALATIRRVITLQPDHGGAFYYAGLIRRRRGENGLAKINFIKGLRYPELGYNAHYYLGRICAEGGDYAAAVAHMQAYIRATSHEAGRSEAERLIEQYRARAGDAVEHMRSAPTASSAPQSIIRRCDFPGAVLMPYLHPWIDSIGLVSRIPALQNADRLIRRGKFGEAAGVLDMWLAGEDTIAGAWALYNLGVCRFRTGEVDRAGEAFRAFLSRVSDYPDRAVVEMLVAASLLDSDGDECEQRLQSALKSAGATPAKATMYELLGQVYARQQRWKDGQRAFEQAVKLAPPESDPAMRASYGRALMLKRQGKYAQALSVLAWVHDQAARRGTLFFVPETWYQRAEIYLAQGLSAKALKTFRHAVDSFPEFIETPWGLYQIHSLALRCGDSTEAARAANELRVRFAHDYWARQPPPVFSPGAQREPRTDSVLRFFSSEGRHDTTLLVHDRATRSAHPTAERRRFLRRVYP